MRYFLWQSDTRLPRGAGPLRHLPHKSMTHVITSLIGLMGLSALSGCHGRAYNDLYVENMAAEIRDLEDQLYEYDHEYRRLEQELASLRQENLSLKTTGSQPEKRLFPNLKSRSGLDSEPQKTLPIKPEPVLTPPDEPAGAPPSILESERPAAPLSPYPSDELPAPQLSPPETNVPPATNPSITPRVPRSQLPGLTPPNGKSGAEFDMNELLPPTIDPGEPMPPPSMPSLPDAAQQVAPENQLELNLSRIEVPSMLAGQSSGNKASIQLVPEKVTDTRVTEIGFHSSLSRAINLDDRADDDGLYLVLQPKNERGQMVPEAADLSVVVLDPAREGNAARIGRWDYSAADVQTKMQPIGSNQGIHLSLPWNGPDPSADRVIVFVRYTFENGRQVIGQKEIFVSSDGGLKTVWAPRGSQSTSPKTLEPAEADVAQAAYQEETAANRVVRPAAGTAVIQDAPLPEAKSGFLW